MSVKSQTIDRAKTEQALYAASLPETIEKEELQVVVCPTDFVNRLGRKLVLLGMLNLW